MKTLEYRHNCFDPPKAEWGEGPWESEPDKVQWRDETTGLPCLVVRNHFGAWCGYVGVSQGHPAFGRDYDDVGVDVHGGLTFASTCQEHEPGAAGEAAAICHVVEDGEDDNVWWLGFDCAHAFDYVPAMEARYRGTTGPLFGEPLNGYMTLGQVQGEVRRLAEQLAAMQKEEGNEHVG